MAFVTRTLAGTKLPSEYNEASLDTMPGRLGDLVGYTDPRCRGQIYRVVQVTNGGAGMAEGELVMREDEVTGTVVTGSVRHIDDAAAFTADAHMGDLVTILNDNAVAGADPEGDVRLIGQNTAGKITLQDGEADFSAAPAVNDTFVIKRMWKACDAADGDNRIDLLGILPCDVTQDYYALALVYGYCDFAKVKAATTAGDPIVADTVQVGPPGSDEIKLQIGHCYAASHAGEAGVGGLIFIDLLSFLGVEEA